MLENPVTEITIAMEVNYFQLNRAEYFVPVAVKMPGSELALARRRGAARTMIDFIGEVKDDYGVTVQNVRDKLDIKLSDDTATQLAKRPIQYETGFTLLPGKYVIKFSRAMRRPDASAPISRRSPFRTEQGRQAGADQLGRPQQSTRASWRRFVFGEEGRGSVGGSRW